jgi:ribosomal protein S12 methylthiotransferase accessory factor
VPIQYSSSLRVRPIEETLAIARGLAGALGVVRVTDTTPLDRIGVPVFAAIRPAAEEHSLCVSAGKGLTANEARVGAYMEAIELAFAERSRAGVRVFAAEAADVLDGRERADAIIDFSPHSGADIEPTTILDCVEATDLASGAPVTVPAEKVIYPYVKHDYAKRSYFSSDGNGIASGNSLEEATLHGLLEVVERDVTSFHNVFDRSQLVVEPPAAIAALADHLDGLGFDLWLRDLPNELGIPTMKAILRERGDVLWGVHFGWGSHLDRSIAAVRAVTEAVQHRLSMIHGARDDIHRSIEARARISPEGRKQWIERHVAAAANVANGVVRYGTLANASEVTDIDAGIELVMARLATQGLSRVLRVQLGPRDLPVAFVRVIVPGAELFGHGIANSGPRLRRFARSLAPGIEVRDPSLESTK